MREVGDVFQEKIEKFEIEEQVPINDVDMVEEDHNAEKFNVQMLNLDEEQEEIHASLATEEEIQKWLVAKRFGDLGNSAT
ncbi:hypothetical protein GH714_036731 [Hevea brasiliensis]|uniref:Uncharacterized protein n=1 Tax=Hevea brasiliensis TaxID=3981 RepID=A0A6A6M8D1_HEVBR|nr:hypothetical protein GH714_036731 [Hevea brasiliensis]